MVLCNYMPLGHLEAMGIMEELFSVTAIKCAVPTSVWMPSEVNAVWFF